MVSGINKNNNKPNFLIVGAAKSGTTSLANYLNKHPDIFIPEIKEPRFLIKDTIIAINNEDPLKEYLLKSSVLDLEEYSEMYNVCHKMKGDASVHYLSDHKEAIPRIKKYLGDVPIFIIIRSPINRLVSHYSFLQDRYLDLSLEEAVKSEEDKKKNCYNSFWFLKENGLYYNKIDAYKNNFTRVKIIIFEEFVKDTEDVYANAIEWLGLSDDYCISFEVENQTLSPTMLYNLLQDIGVPRLFRVLTEKLGINLELLQRIKRKIFFRKPIVIISDDLQESLIEYYKEDVRKLQDLYNLNLTSWGSDFI